MRAELRAPPIKINELAQANERTSGVQLSNDSVFLSLGKNGIYPILPQSLLYEYDSCRLYRAVFVYAFIHFIFLTILISWAKTNMNVNAKKNH